MYLCLIVPSELLIIFRLYEQSCINNLDWSMDYFWGKLEMQTNEGSLNLAMEIAQTESLEYAFLNKMR